MRNYGLVLLGVWGLLTGCKGGDKPTQGDLTVAGSPVGLVAGQIRVILNFSRPMVARDRLDQPVTAMPLEIVPEIAGEARWSDDKTLVLVPAKSLPISTKFVVTVPGDAKALDGSRLGKAHSFEFMSERLGGLVEVVGSPARASRTPIVKLVFNQEVPVEQVTQHCSYDAKAVRHAVKLAPDSNAGPARTYTVVPAAELAMDTDWVVSCRPALRGSAGNMGLAAPIEAKLHTFGPLRFVSLDPKGDDIVPDESTTLSIAFTNPLAPPYQMKISPAIAGFPQRCHGLGDSPPGLSCEVQLEARTSYTLTIDATQRDAFGQTLDKPQVLTFRTADAEPTVSMESGYFVAELTRPVLPVWTRNVGELQLTIAEITPANFHELRPRLEWWDSAPADLSKTKLAARAKKVAVAGIKNQWGQRPIDPAALLGKKPGPGMYYIEVGSSEVHKAPFEEGGRQKVLVNFTDIGVVSKLSPSRGLVWATQLSTGKPLPGANVTVRDAAGKLTWSGTTDADGVAFLPGTDKLDGTPARAATDADGLEEGEVDEGDEGGGASGMRIYVQAQGDWTMVNPTRTGGLSPWAFNVSQDYTTSPVKLRGFMHTDRGLYQPGEKVHVKGLARVSKLGGALTVPGDSKKVEVEVRGPQGKVFTEAEARLSPFGGFWFDLELPGDARLGDYQITARLEHGTFTRSFTVEAYRPATFEVTGKAKTARVIRRGALEATVSANYLYGAPLRSGEVAVAVHSRPRRVAFPQHADFEFDDERRREAYAYGNAEDAQTLVTETRATLDAKGNAALSVPVSPNDVPVDSDLLVRASVTAPSNEVINKTFTIPYYRARKYFGIKSPGWFLAVKKPQRFEILAVSPDGKVVDGPAKLTVTRRDWNCVWEEWGYRGTYQCKDTTETVLSQTLQVTGGKPASFELNPQTGGNYWVVIESTTDPDQAQPAAMQLHAWGDGGGAWQSSDTLQMDIVADKPVYKAGDTATLLLKTDLAEATGLVTIERDGVLERRLIQVTPTTKHLSVPITGSHAPNVYVSVALVQGRMGTGPRGKPRMRMGLVNLSVRPEDNTLNVTVATDRKDYRPGTPVTATIKVTDKSGAPVAAEVSITAADEGVLSLIGFQTPDPVPTFYAPWGLGVSTATQLEYIRDIPGPNTQRPATGGDAAGTLRSRFVSTAVWTPGAVTDAAGLATVTFEAPDNLTAFRIMAVAADKGHRFGSADQRFTVSKPLQLHQALPRFLNVGDVLAGGVIVHNETGKPGTAIVKLVTDKRLTNQAAGERTITVAKGARVPVLFDLVAADVGESVLGFSVTMNGESDAVRLELPIRHPSPPRMHHVAHATTRDATTIPLTPPPDAIPGSAEVVISVDPDGLAGVEDGLADLVGYPYGCLEQTTSKVIPMIAVRELAESLAIEGLSGEQLQRYVRAGIAKIGRHQTAYGGFSLWPGGEPDAYYTAYALWGLYLAKQAGYPVDQVRIDDALAYLKSDGGRPDTSRPYYDEAGNLGSQAFALYIRAVLGDKDTQAATTMLANPKLPVYGKAYLARALAAGTGAKDPAVVKLVGELGALASAAAKAEAGIVEPSDRNMRGYMSSSLRTTAMVLAALVELDPKHDAIKPLVRAVMKQRRGAAYLDTQENLYVLLGLTSYARTVTQKPPTVTIELGDKRLFAGALSGKNRIRVVSAPLSAPGAVVITPKGEVSYSVEIRHRRKLSSLAAEANGVVLQRELLDEAGKPKTTFQVGDVVRVRITTQLKDDAPHLMVSDPLAAGFEALNTRFATVGSAGVQQTQGWGTYREMYDDRVDFASEWSSRGGYVHEYTIRAIAVGKFARPPTVVELMYEPEINGRTALDTIEVKAK